MRIFRVGFKEPSGPLGVEDAIYRITAAMEQQTLLEMACGIDDLRLEYGSNHVKLEVGETTVEAKKKNQNLQHVDSE